MAKNFRGTNIILLAVILVFVVLLAVGDKLVPGSKRTADTAKKSTTTQTAAAAPAATDEPKPDVPVLLQERYKTIAKSIDIDRVKADVYSLSKYESRMVGYKGCDDAAKYVEEQFKNIGLSEVAVEEFDVTVPVDKDSKLVIGEQEFDIHALWPNLVRTSHLPPEGLDVHVIDAGGGKLPDFDGDVVMGSVALVDFNSGTEWLNAPRLGARALIFVEPEDTMRGEGEAKFSAIPVSMPRFWISKENAAAVKQLVAAGQAENGKIYCDMPWEKAKGKNIVGVIPGKDPKLKDQWIVLHASYDATSVVPSLAPGAESTCGIASLFELARMYKTEELAPRRSIMFVATSGHFQGLAGMRSFMEKHIDSYRQASFMENQVYSKLNKGWPAEGKKSAPWPPIVAAIVLLLIVMWVWKLFAGLRRKYAWVAVVPAVVAIAAIYLTVNLFGVFNKGFDYKLPDPKKFYVWAGLDLTSQTEGVGVFYKGYFYDMREDIQGNFSDLASRTRENSERVAHTLDFYDKKDNRFADGVNPISGKNWRNFIPGKFALDSEVITLAGGKGISFASIYDGRQMVDTPFDTVEKINFDNLGKQLEMIACLSDHWMRDINQALDEEYVKAEVVDAKTVSVADPMSIGFVLGVYDNRYGKGTNYYKPKAEKDLPASLAKNVINLTTKYDGKAKELYILHKPLTKLGAADPCKFTRMGLQGGFAKLSGNVVQYDPRKSFVPNLRVGDCLAVVRSPFKSYMGVRANIIDKTTPITNEDNPGKKEGYFEIPGVAPVTAGGSRATTSLGAYKLDYTQGDIIMAPDQGSYGQFYPTDFQITTGYKDMPVIVFDCKATSIYDLIDPQSLRALGGLSVYDGDTDGAPKQFGSAVAVPEPGNPHVEDMAVIFTEDTVKSKKKAIGADAENEFRRIRIKLTMSSGPAATRLLLLNSALGNEIFKVDVKKMEGKKLFIDRPMEFFIRGVYTDKEANGTNYIKTTNDMYTHDGLFKGQINLEKALPEGTETVYIRPIAEPEGVGYDFTEGGTLDETAYKVSKDMWTLDEYRLARLESKGVVNEGLRKLHDDAKRFLDLATQAKDSLNYSVFDSYCRAAWGYEARAYPDVTKTSQDVVNGVIFYLFLMLPFAFFCERLFFAFPDLKKQILAFFGIFIGIFFVFKYVHPAFQIAGDAMIVLIAFIMLALSTLVIFIITSKFEEQLKQFNRSVSGIHKADIGRMSVAAAAFSLGISNMRRRKARTVLTCITLVLLTFTVLSFTSIVSELRFNKVPAKKDIDTHIYDGIMIRTAMWDPLQEVAYRLLKDEYGNKVKDGKKVSVAPRAWFYGTAPGEQSFLTVKRNGLAYDARAACGMTPEEAKIMDFDTSNRKVFVAGDWFGYKDGKPTNEKINPYSIIIPQAIAEKLEIKPSDVGKAQVEFAGAKYTVIGIFDNKKFKKIKDLDNEPLTPVDFIMMSKQSQQQSSASSEAGFREYTHLEPDSVFIVPFETLMNLGGDVRSVAIKFISPEEVQNQLDSLMYRLGLNLYAGIGDSIYRYSSIAASSSKGFSNVFIPVLIAALIVLNTMLGSVYERVKEIGIFSSIGLAPNHIAVLFIAESLVYANLGAVAGYVLGQTASKILMATNALPGLYLNFSSMSAVVSSLVVVAVVLLSTLYPARKASEVATPSVDRSWKVPDPVGDNWDIVLPFAVTGEQAVGVNGFLREWFQAYEEYSIGDFVTQDVESGTTETDDGTAYTISCKTWLAPFDLGVSQTVQLATVPTSMEDVYEVKLRLTRESGDVSNWKRVNRRFLNTLRKQFLIWRTLRAEDRDKYLQGGAAAAEEVTADKGPEVAPA